MLRALTTVRPGDETVTARPALLTEVAGTPARSALVEALIDARLLVSDEDAGGHVFVRVAHEALLSRWPRAGDIVNANRNFLETRDSAQGRRPPMASESRNRELLLPSGKRLAEGEELLLSRREEVDDDVIEYIEASSRAQQQREEKDRQAERALIEAAEEAKRERLEREAERRSLAGCRGKPACPTYAQCGDCGDGARLSWRAQAHSSPSGRSRKRGGNATRRCATSLFRSRFFRSSPRRQATPRLRSFWRSKHCPRKTRSERPYLFEAEAALYKALLAHHQIKIFRHGAGVADAAFNRERRSHRHCILR